MASLEMNVNQVNADLKAIKDSITASGVEVAEGTKTADYAEKVVEVYEAGKKAEYDAFWDSVLPINYVDQQCAFAGPSWNDKTFYPDKDIVFRSGRGDYLFFCNVVTNIKQRLAECGVKMDLSKVTHFYNTFTYATTRELPEISAVNATSLYAAFSDASKLVTIDKFILKDDGSQKFQSTFNSCKALENVTFEGVIGQNGLDLQWSTKLSKASIESVINCLSTTTSGLTVTLSKTAKEAAFTVDEWSALIATRNNWTISLV